MHSFQKGELPADLVGMLPPMSVAGANKMQLIDLAGTSISQYSTCSRSGKSDEQLHPNDCLPSWLTATTSSPNVPLGVEGMLCPQLDFNRTATPVLTYTQVNLMPCKTQLAACFTQATLDIWHLMEALCMRLTQSSSRVRPCTQLPCISVIGRSSLAHSQYSQPKRRPQVVSGRC